jgi:hypothetical protein
VVGDDCAKNSGVFGSIVFAAVLMVGGGRRALACTRSRVQTSPPTLRALV